MYGKNRLGWIWTTDWVRGNSAGWKETRLRPEFATVREGQQRWDVYSKRKVNIANSDGRVVVDPRKTEEVEGGYGSGERRCLFTEPSSRNRARDLFPANIHTGRPITCRDTLRAVPYENDHPNKLGEEDSILIQVLPHTPLTASESSTSCGMQPSIPCAPARSAGVR